MTLLTPVYDYLSRREALADLDEDAEEALLDLLMLAVLMDGRITDEEIDNFDDLLEELPFASRDEDTFEQMLERAESTRDRLVAIAEDDDEISTFVQVVAPEIDEPHRELALEMVAIVLVADGLAWRENALIDELGVAFEFESSKIDGIVARVIDRHKADEEGEGA